MAAGLPSFRCAGRLCCILLSGVVCACSPTNKTGTLRSAGAREALTFNQDIAPILFARCSSCHRPGQSAPFSVLDYLSVRGHARQIAAATAARVMPPWPPEPGYGEFAVARLVPQQEIDKIQQWFEEGAIEGSSANRPEPPKWSDGWQLGSPDLIVSMSEPYTLGPDGSDEFRSFVIPLPIASVRYLRAVEFDPENAKIVHHAVIAIDRTRSSRDADAHDPKSGFEGMLPSGVEGVSGWTPGKAAFVEPPGITMPLQSGNDLVLQLHMLPTGKPETIRSRVGLYFGTEPPSRGMFTIKLGVKTIDIPAGRSDYTIEDSYDLPVDVEALSIYPHAHYLADGMKVTARLPDGTVKWLLWIRKWNFRWQDEYRYSVPLVLPRGTRLTMQYTYDNSDANVHNPHHPPQRIQWGPRSSDEMGDLWLRVMPRSNADLPLLVKDVAEHEARTDIAEAEAALRAEPGNGRLSNLLATRYLRAGRVPDAIREFEEGLRLQPDDAEAHNILGTIFQSVGRLDDAVSHLRSAVRLVPHDDRFHFNLGNALNASGHALEAALEFRQAAEINPNDSEALNNLGMALAATDRLEEALTHLRRAIELDPANADAHNNVGVVLGFLGRHEAARLEFERALTIRPGFSRAADNLRALTSRAQPPGSRR